jgi:glycosyltransferase involved in cell wall biosynthesis
VEALASKDRAGGRLAPDDDLELRLEVELPARLGIGGGNALFVYGSCFHRRRRVTGLRILADDRSIEPMAHGMPRRDLFDALHAGAFDHTGKWARERDTSTEDPEGHAYRSAFWGIVPFEPIARRRVAEIRVAARLDDGTDAVGDLATLELEPSSPSEPVSWRDGRRSDEPLVAICMATYNPPPDLFRSQIESIRDQTHENWVCVISDDCSVPSRFAEIEALLDGDSRFVVSRSERRLGFYRNFERALAMAPEQAEYVTLADQDDRWDRDKLRVLISSLGDAQLAYSDARIVGRHGEVISDTYWSRRRTNHSNLGSLLVTNTITGAASLFRRKLVDRILPFPSELGNQWHDHWIGLVALATGSIEYVDRPLYDYVQHRGAAIGHAFANEGPLRRPYRERLRMLRSDPRAAFTGWRGKYFYGLCRGLLLARVLELRSEGALRGRKRRALQRFLAIDRSPLSYAWLSLRRARRLVGLNETLGSERVFLHGVAWRRIITVLNWRRREPSPRLLNDASLPSPEVAEAGAVSPEVNAYSRFIREKLAPLELDVRGNGPERVNLLIPTLDLRHFFGGYMTKLNLARRMAERGVRTRVVAVDEVAPLPRDWKRRVEAQAGLRGLFDSVEVSFAHGRALDVTRRDCFVASTWWTAHRAHRALESLERERFVYLIQEYEPNTFPMGAHAAIAAQSYDFPHFAVFSTQMLREFFNRRRIGVYASGPEAGERDSVAFLNAITAVQPPSIEELRARRRRRLLFYARPEQNNARNMFELALVALVDCIAEGTFGPEWRFHGIGATERWQRLTLGPRATMEVVARADQSEYAELLESHDVGLALMYTPHPSLVPIEMASAGMLVVTNSFENKTPEAMAQISPNLITTAPSLDGIKQGLREAAGRVDDLQGRVSGASVEWSTDWDSSFNDRVMERVAGFLAAS